jgi:hypothetical protein
MSRDALRELYRQVWPSFAALPVDQGLSWPLFIALPDAYSTARLKLLVVGQETFSWWGLLGTVMGDDPVGTVMACYDRFKLGEGYRSPFWDATRELVRLLGGSASVGLAWSNLYPCDQRKRRPDKSLRRPLLDLRLLPQEVAVLKPDAVIFFTGPRYHDALTSLFPDARLAEAGAPPGQWVQRVAHVQLPAASFRTYHPAYLRRKRQGAVIDTLAALITQGIARSP